MNCPNCGAPDVHTVWCTGRMQRDECRDCGWEGRPRPPKKKRAETTRYYVPDGGAGGWTYEGIDGRGWTYVYSQGYSTERACREAARKDLENMKNHPAYGKCRAVIWPPMVKVRGLVMK